MIENFRGLIYSTNSLIYITQDREVSNLRHKNQFSTMHRMITNIEYLISFGFSASLVGSIENGGEDVEFSVGPISFEGIVGLLSIGEFHQEIEEIVSAGVLSFIEVSIARVVLISFGVSIVIVFISFIIVNDIASEPSFKSQSAPERVILMEFILILTKCSNLVG